MTAMSPAHAGVEQLADLAAHERRLLPVQAALAVGFELLVEAGSGRVDELDRRLRDSRGGHARQVGQQVLRHRGIGLQLAS